jgi:peptide/nickel transport system ATP-binding protein
VLETIRDLCRSHEVAALYVSHDLAVVSALADRVAVMYAGQVVEAGPVRELFGAPQHPYTRGLMSCIPVPGRTERGGKLGTIPGVVPSLVGELRGCSFRDRCPLAQPECALAIPIHVSAAAQQWRCIFGEAEVAA